MTYNLNQVMPSGGALAARYMDEMIEADLQNAVVALHNSMGMTQAEQASYSAQRDAAIAAGQDQQTSLQRQGFGQITTGATSIGGMGVEATVSAYKNGGLAADRAKVANLENAERAVRDVKPNVTVANEPAQQAVQDAEAKTILANIKGQLRSGGSLDAEYPQDPGLAGPRVTYADKMAQLGSPQLDDLSEVVSREAYRANKALETKQQSIQTAAAKWDTAVKAAGNAGAGGWQYAAGAAEAAKAQHDADNACLRSQSSVLESQSRTFGTWYDGQSQAAGKGVDARTQILLANRT